MVEAFRAEGLKAGFYYSLIDWHHPEFTIDRVHPMRNNEQERAKNVDWDIVKYAQLLSDASEIKFVDRVGHWLDEEKKEDTITLQLPVKQPDVVVPVIELFLE